MARRVAYYGALPITLAEVAQQCRLEVEDLQPELIEQVIIPGVTAQAEHRTGAAIRMAEYEEYWPESYESGRPLDVGQATSLISIWRRRPSGSFDGISTPTNLEQGPRESYLHFPAGRPPGHLRIRYWAGVNLKAYPGVRLWLLMSAATAYEYRETLVSGSILAELPSRFTDSLLADITVPPRF